jgi:hypothetical protein
VVEVDKELKVLQVVEVDKELKVLRVDKEPKVTKELKDSLDLQVLLILDLKKILNLYRIQ